ncbi:hypothetical protein [Streptomyces sp. NPDC017673]|uniref:hypothetical protein n=1 Tax=unclassified Streptomyces TaxID=2593676 RepID=UPI0037B53BC3
MSSPNDMTWEPPDLPLGSTTDVEECLSAVVETVTLSPVIRVTTRVEPALRTVETGKGADVPADAVGTVAVNAARTATADVSPRLRDGGMRKRTS